MNLHSVAIACAALIISLSLTTIRECEAGGFSIDLIHRDYLRSPKLDSFPTHSERVANSLRRSFNRLDSLKKGHSSPSTATDIVNDRGEYLIKIALGTPPVETLAIADTGSDLIWVQCKPCVHCFDQNAPLFDPKLSSSYKPIPCESSKCEILPKTSCNGSRGTCGYTVAYGDRSYSKGDLATETITLGSIASGKASFPNVTMGCGHNDQGTFGPGTSGIVGLGGGKVSLITQLGEGKFSYCLLPYGSETSKRSKMNFGDRALVSGKGVVSTPIVKDSPDTFYYLTLEAITIGNEMIRFHDSSTFPAPLSDKSGEGNIIIDSGTTLTFLPAEFYEEVEESVRRQIEGREVDDPHGMLSLCYFASDVKTVPKITAHFRGADVELKPVNTFVLTSKSSLCFAFAPSSSFSIYGNLAQINFLVGYDLEKNIVSFKPTDCSKE